MVDRVFDRKSLFEDLGELGHVIYLFEQYQKVHEDCDIEATPGPWKMLVDYLREYLITVGVDRPGDLTASDLSYEIRSQDRTDIIAAMRCLGLLLSHCRAHYWDDDAVDDLKHRLTDFYLILTESELHRRTPAAIAGEKHIESQRAKAKKPRPRIKADQGALSTEEIVRDVCVTQDEDLTAKELWSHLYSRLEYLGLEPDEKNDVIVFSGGEIPFGTFRNLVTKVRRQRRRL